MTAPATSPPRLQRAVGRADIAVRLRMGASRLARLRQEGCYRVRLPRTPDGAPEAVLLNTAGGIAGGDRLTVSAGVESGARLTVTTQAAERVYRSTGPAGVLDTHLTVEAGGRLDWLPQETIVFDGGRLTRRLTVELAADARFLAVESVVLGRAAMGETVTHGLLRDDWRIHRDGSLVHAEALRIEDFTALGGPGTLQGARGFATLAYIAPDAADRLESVRAALPETAGASAWDGKLIVRIVSAQGRSLRAALLPALAALRDAPMPTVWRM